MALYLVDDRVVYIAGGIESTGVIIGVHEDISDEDDIPMYEIRRDDGNHFEISEDDIIDFDENDRVEAQVTTTQATPYDGATITITDHANTQAEPGRASTLDHFIWDYTPVREVSEPRDMREVIEITRENSGMLTHEDYRPSADSRRHCIIPLQDGTRLTPSRVIGGWVFKDASRETWYNEIAEPNVRLYATHEDIRHVRWASATTVINYARGGGEIKIKEKKKLRRKYPMPDLKDKKHYDSNDYIA